MSVIDRIRASAGRLTLCGLGVFALGFGVQWNHGNLSTLGLFLVLLSAALAGAALCRGRWHQSRGWWAVIAALCGLTMLHYPLPLVPQSNGGVQIVFVALLTASATAGAWLPEGRRADALVGLAWLSLVGLVAASWTWGKAQIDLFTAMMGGSERLLQGHNPYGPVFTYVIGTTPLKIAQGRFPYGPIVPFLAAPGRLIGDVRVMSVVAVTMIVAGLWRLTRQGDQRSQAHRVVAVAIASPLSAAMIHQSWVDVYMLAGIVWWLALRRDHRRLSMVALAIGMLVKPTSLILLVPAFLWSHRARIECVIGGVGALVVTLPFALATGVGTFVYAVLGIQLASPFRTDSLNLAAYLFRLAHWVPPTTLLPIVLLVVAVAVIAWRGRPVVEGDLAIQAAILQVVAFAFAKEAAFNYYFAPEIMLLAAMAGAGVPLLPEDVSLPWTSSIARISRLLGMKGHQPVTWPGNTASAHHSLWREPQLHGGSAGSSHAISRVR